MEKGINYETKIFQNLRGKINLRLFFQTFSKLIEIVSPSIKFEIFFYYAEIEISSRLVCPFTGLIITEHRVEYSVNK